MNTEKFNRAIQLIDQANSEDPNIETWQGKEYPKEVLYSLRMSDMLTNFMPSPSTALKLAARSQHICRWEHPRKDYEMNRSGYLLWRKEQNKFHAKKTGEILASIDFDAETIEKVQFLLLKKQLKKDLQTQALEDVVCLVFLQYYFTDFAAAHSEEKIISVLQKTWAKMSEQGHQKALTLSLPENDKELIVKALS
ncbi:DUF4202 domain-containing protein [Thalassotalea psychrophila]|uniref:DUF4202 domain-containing protein n=1 Tax=Thalassotalea psychrophila TaxID=3065647 RepID=A0ABY9TSK5_9GAMM|nr:DUF4202 domain-containing protein [Colwelliaceae bacterium SQ149]